MTWNDGAERIKGYNASEIIGKHFSVFYPKEAIATGHPTRALALANKNNTYQEEGWRIKKNGALFWADVVITALYEAGELIGFAKITRDLSERKEAQEQQSQMEAELLQRAKHSITF
jgi:PAS domain S-box-containing protein